MHLLLYVQEHAPSEEELLALRMDEVGKIVLLRNCLTCQMNSLLMGYLQYFVVGICIHIVPCTTCSVCVALRVQGELECEAAI